jgi:hypothetical protein
MVQTCIGLSSYHFPLPVAPTDHSRRWTPREGRESIATALPVQVLRPRHGLTRGFTLPSPNSPLSPIARRSGACTPAIGARTRTSLKTGCDSWWSACRCRGQARTSHGEPAPLPRLLHPDAGKEAVISADGRWTSPGARPDPLSHGAEPTDEPVGAHAGGVVGVAASRGPAVRPEGQPVGRPGSPAFTRRPLQRPEARGDAPRISARAPGCSARGRMRCCRGPSSGSSAPQLSSVLATGVPPYFPVGVWRPSRRT